MLIKVIARFDQTLSSIQENHRSWNIENTKYKGNDDTYVDKNQIFKAVAKS